MASPFPSFVSHLDNYINPDRSEAQHVDSQDVVISLLLKGTISIQEVVSELGAYLTTTENAVRARGILLLAELMKGLATTKLADSVLHSMSMFFADRLADWHGIRGALLGSLALLKRSKCVGAISDEDAIKFANSFLENLHVQALVQQDRILCLELLESLLGTYPAAISSLGSDLVYGVCSAIEGETDPRCLFLSFHIVEQLARLFPDPEGPVGDCAEDLFDIISRYFPISFTPPPNDTRGITRDDLAIGLQRAFASTPLFSSPCISLLLEKLSSSLRVAKIDSLRYLGLCALEFGGKVMGEFSRPIWIALKSQFFSSSLAVKSIFDIMPNPDQEMLNEALTSMRRCIAAFYKQADSSDSDNFRMPEIQQVLALIIDDDESVGDLFKFMENSAPPSGSGEVIVDDMDPQLRSILNREELTSKAQVTIAILSAVSEVSCSACFFVLNKVLRHILGTLKELSSHYIATVERNASTSNAGYRHLANLAAMLLSTKIVDAAKGLAQDQVDTFIKTYRPSNIDSVVNKDWLEPLRVKGPALVSSYIGAITFGKQISLAAASNRLGRQYCQLGVDGLQALASFPASLSPLPLDQLNEIVSFLSNILMEKEQYDFVWDYALKAVSSINAMEERYKELGINRTYILDEVIPRFLNMIVQSKCCKEVEANLEVVSIISASRPSVLERVLHSLGDTMSSWLPQTMDKSESTRDTRKVVAILQCLSQKLLPLCGSQKGNLVAASKILSSIWSSIEVLPVPSLQYSEQIMTACMEVTSIVVQKCDASVQENILLKALQIAADRLNLCEKDNNTKSMVFSDHGVRSQSIPYLVESTLCHQRIQETWLIGLISSIVIAIRPGLLSLQSRNSLKFFLEGALVKGWSPCTESAAQALASILNKWEAAKQETHLSLESLPLEDAIDFVLTNESMSPMTSFLSSNILESSYSSDRDFSSQRALQSVRILSWVGKALAMRGNAQVKNIAVMFLSILRSTDLRLEKVLKNDESCTNFGSEEHELNLATAVAEGCGIIIKESKALSKECHAIVRPLYKQRFISSMLPLFLQALHDVGNCKRIFLLRGFGHLISESSHTALLSEVQLVLPMLLEALLALSMESKDMELLMSTLLVLSSFLVDVHNGRNAAADHVTTIVTCLIRLLQYPFSAMVREVVLQCLGSVVGLPYSRVYPMRIQVLKALDATLDDNKRSVRREAVRCRRIWRAISAT